MKVLLGVTGSVAAKLTPRLVEALRAANHEVKVVATEKSLFFWKPVEVMVPVLRDADEWSTYQTGQPILHIELRRWADAMIIAPLTANTLAKIANGIADNLLTSIVRAWTPEKTIVMAPAMNSQMWGKSVTFKQLAEIRLSLPRVTLVHPVSKVLACGDIGIGAMASIPDIVASLPKEVACAP